MLVALLIILVVLIAIVAWRLWNAHRDWKFQLKQAVEQERMMHFEAKLRGQVAEAKWRSIIHEMERFRGLRPSLSEIISRGKADKREE